MNGVHESVLPEKLSLIDGILSAIFKVNYRNNAVKGAITFFMSRTLQLHCVLQQLEAELRRCQLWQSQPPSAQALTSQEPFAIDTLAPHEWLQWVFMPRMLALIEAEAPLPRGFALTPYFEEVWKDTPSHQPLLVLVMDIDRMCA